MNIELKNSTAEKNSSLRKSKKITSLIGGSKSDIRRFRESAKKMHVHLNCISNVHYVMNGEEETSLYIQENKDIEETLIIGYEDYLPMIRSTHNMAIKADLMALSSNNILCTSNHIAVNRCANKIITQAVVGRNKNIRYPKAIILKRGIELSDIQELIEKHFKNLEYFILQLPYGSQGKTTFLAANPREIHLLLQLSPLIIVKEFIDTKIDNKVSSVRLFFVDAEFVAGFKAYGFDHTSNVSKHHNAEPFMNPPQELLDMSDEVMKELKCYDVAGIDFIQSVETGKWYFLEANSNPGFGIADITGVDVPGKIIDFSLRNGLSDKAKKLRDA